MAVGFGVRTPREAAEIARAADAVVVGSALVDKIAGSADLGGAASGAIVQEVLGLARDLSGAVRAARR